MVKTEKKKLRDSFKAIKRQILFQKRYGNIALMPSPLSAFTHKGIGDIILNQKCLKILYFPDYNII